ncbi:hypothetical protein J6590_083981 [Homalodisca vitripennis]|nr:hypothetical protein J6590_083981 [Homalodisca vitripennis]
MSRSVETQYHDIRGLLGDVTLLGVIWLPRCDDTSMFAVAVATQALVATSIDILAACELFTIYLVERMLTADGIWGIVCGKYTVIALNC